VYTPCIHGEIILAIKERRKMDLGRSRPGNCKAVAVFDSTLRIGGVGMRLAMIPEDEEWLTHEPESYYLGEEE